MAEQPTPQNRTDGTEAPAEAPDTTPQGRADEDTEGAEEGRPGRDA